MVCGYFQLIWGSLLWSGVLSLPPPLLGFMCQSSQPHLCFSSPSQSPYLVSPHFTSLTQCWYGEDSGVIQQIGVASLWTVTEQVKFIPLELRQGWHIYPGWVTCLCFICHSWAESEWGILENKLYKYNNVQKQMSLCCVIHNRLDHEGSARWVRGKEMG